MSRKNTGDDDFEDDLSGVRLPGEYAGSGPVDPAQRLMLRQDLRDINALRIVMAPRGVRGVSVWCPECEEDHYLEWDLLAGNLQELLGSGRAPVHEPAFSPNPLNYVSWEYARGFLDGTQAPNVPKTPTGKCPWCGEGLPRGKRRLSYCPACGKSLAPMNLIAKLRKMGWPQGDVDKLLHESGFEYPIPPHDAG